MQSDLLPWLALSLVIVLAIVGLLLAFWPPPGRGRANAELRLRELERTHALGLISDHEFQRKRAQIIDDI